MRKSNVVRLTARDGALVEYVDENPIQGGMKDVYFSPERSYVVAFFRKPLDFSGKERLEKLVGEYRTSVFDKSTGDYWNSLYRWPERIVEQNGLWGLVVPAYQEHFFFGASTSLAGVEKEGKWFSSAKNFNRFLPAEEKGTFAGYLTASLLLSRAVRRMHAAGLAHSDLSYKNCLIDPVGGRACIIDIDGLVVPHLFPPEVIGTPDFIAPEVIATRQLSVQDPGRRLPCRETDQHALAVLVYMYLLHRHPLRGGKVHDTDNDRQEELEMGTRALFIEHSHDLSNRPRLGISDAPCLPWLDPEKLPYTVCGPYLKELFDKAFIDGLHAPVNRPTADDWETALVRTFDLLIPCMNPSCVKKWFVFDSRIRPVCPFCGTPYEKVMPVLNFYSSHNGRDFRYDNHRLLVFEGQQLFPWHASRLVFQNEHLKTAERQPVADFELRQGQWVLINRTLAGLKNLSEGKMVPVGGSVVLKERLQLQLSAEAAGRIVQVQMVGR